MFQFYVFNLTNTEWKQALMIWKILELDISLHVFPEKYTSTSHITEVLAKCNKTLQ